jgi:hypothetical protein
MLVNISDASDGSTISVTLLSSNFNREPIICKPYEKLISPPVPGRSGAYSLNINRKAIYHDNLLKIPHCKDDLWFMAYGSGT